MQHFLGPTEVRYADISFSTDFITWSEPESVKFDSVFAWGETPFSVTARYARIIVTSDLLYLNELAFRDEKSVIVPVISTDAPELFDEQYLVPERYTNMNSTYFDEIYHARTAYELINHMPVYEWTHPPLGKALISLGVMLFGMNPFGWRVAGVVAGILMVPLMYIFAKKMFNETFWAAFVAVIFTFDFMHLSQTRVATIDSFVTLFIIVMYYFMFKYYAKDDVDFKNSLKHLFFSGLFMSLAIAVKWQGIYSAGGLAVIFFYSLYRKHLPKMQIICTILCCIIFFVLIPVAIYCLSYWQFLQTPEKQGLISIIENQKDMFNYHAYLESEHPFSSKWWSWPLNIRPIFYYVAHAYDIGKTAAISSFGNPAVWWMGIFALIYAVVFLIRQESQDAKFLIIAYVSQILPWALIGRTTYIYHYFPSVIFVVLIIALMFKNAVRSRMYIYGYLTVVVCLFIMFYPVISGMYVDTNYIKFLKWLPSWQLM